MKNNNKLDNIPLIAAITFGWQFSFRFYFAYFPLYLSSIKYSQREISLLLAIFPLSSILLMIPFGIATDKFSPTKFVKTGLILVFISVISIPYASKNFIYFLFIILVTAIGNSLCTSGCNSLYYKTIGEDRKEIKIGFYNSILHLSYGVGPFVSGLLFKYIKMREIFLFSGIITFPFLLASLSLKKTVQEEFPFREYKKAILKKELLILLFIIFIFSLHYGVENVCFSLYLQNNLSMTKQIIGEIYLIVGLVLVASAFISATILRKIKYPIIVMISGMLLSGLSLAALNWCNSFSDIVLAKIFHVYGDAAFILFYSVSISKIIDEKMIGGPLGLFNALTTTGGFIGSLLSGAFGNCLFPFVLVGLMIVMLTLVLSITFAKYKLDFQPKSSSIPL